MEHSLIYDTNGWVVIGILLLLMIAAYFLGKVIGDYRFKLNGEKKFEGSGTILGALFALLGLLLAFTFHMAGSRHDMRRQLVIDEANCIRTAIHRADMYEENDRIAFRSDFKKYLEVRIAYFEVSADWDKIEEMEDSSNEIATTLWDRAAKLSKSSQYGEATKQMIPALNNLIDITVARKYASLARVPDQIIYMLFILAIVNSFFTGYAEFGSKRKDWLVVIGFCAITVLVIYNILDLDRPRRGLITLSKSNESIKELRELFK